MREGIVQILAGMVGSLGFSILFGVRKKYIGYIALNAGLSWAVYLVVSAWLGAFAGNVFSAACCSLVAAKMARVLRVPTVVVLTPATVPMIPGGSLYYTMYYLFSGDRALGETYLLATAQAIFGMAIGFAIVSVVIRAFEKKQAAAAV